MAGAGGRVQLVRAPLRRRWRDLAGSRPERGGGFFCGAGEGAARGGAGEQVGGGGIGQQRLRLGGLGAEGTGQPGAGGGKGRLAPRAAGVAGAAGLRRR